MLQSLQIYNTFHKTLNSFLAYFDIPHFMWSFLKILVIFTYSIPLFTSIQQSLGPHTAKNNWSFISNWEWNKFFPTKERKTRFFYIKQLLSRLSWRSISFSQLNSRKRKILRGNLAWGAWGPYGGTWELRYTGALSAELCSLALLYIRENLTTSGTKQESTKVIERRNLSSDYRKQQFL